jgi:hypothetical protein
MINPEVGNRKKGILFKGKYVFFLTRKNGGTSAKI